MMNICKHIVSNVMQRWGNVRSFFWRGKSRHINPGLCPLFQVTAIFTPLPGKYFCLLYVFFGIPLLVLVLCHGHR